MPNTHSAHLVASANDYTFEQYDDARETRAWYQKFLREHNGKDWRRTLKFSITDLLTGNLPKDLNGETVRIFWYRIKYQGVLVGYADAKIHPIFNGRKVISDVWIIPPFRKRGHFHGSFPALVEYTQAVGVCLMMRKYRLYGSWFESFGFDWLCGFGTDPNDDPDTLTTFLITRSAYKDLLRFMIRYGHGHFGPANTRGQAVYEEVMRELDTEKTVRC